MQPSEASLHEILKVLTTASEVLKSLVNRTLARDAPQFDALREEWKTHSRLWQEYNTLERWGPNFQPRRQRLLTDTLLWAAQMLEWTLQIK